MTEDMRQFVMDYLTPLVAHNVESCTLQDIQTALRDSRTGLTIDRGLLMQLLDPSRVKLIKKIEGDTVYLDTVEAINSVADPDNKEKAAEKLRNKAAKQATKEIKK